MSRKTAIPWRKSIRFNVPTNRSVCDSPSLRYWFAFLLSQAYTYVVPMLFGRNTKMVEFLIHLIVGQLIKLRCTIMAESEHNGTALVSIFWHQVDGEFHKIMMVVFAPESTTTKRTNTTRNIPRKIRRSSCQEKLPPEWFEPTNRVTDSQAFSVLTLSVAQSDDSHVWFR